MIGIKGMELPKSCKECAFCEEFCEEKFCKMESVSIKDETIRQSFCPLVDLGKEDLSWEELKEKCKSFIKKIDKTAEVRNIEYFEIEPCGLSFWEDGIILDEHNDIILTKQSYYQMYQIIKSLVVDER